MELERRNLVLFNLACRLKKSRLIMCFFEAKRSEAFILRGSQQALTDPARDFCAVKWLKSFNLILVPVRTRIGSRLANPRNGMRKMSLTKLYALRINNFLPCYEFCFIGYDFASEPKKGCYIPYTMQQRGTAKQQRETKLTHAT